MVPDKTWLCGPTEPVRNEAYHWSVGRALLRKLEREECVSNDRGGKTKLVLSRRVGEEIVIDEEIRAVVADVRRGRVRLGIPAPLSAGHSQDPARQDIT
jgi:hypothetical protein